MTNSTNWAIEEFQTQGDAIRVAIKDLIDIEGYKTTAGSRLVASSAEVAKEDARCLSAIREANLTIVGKANLHELAYGSTGINYWWGTPRNPIDPSLVPGGSSSGSAVAVANGFADFALGTDTGGSIRIPAAACGSYGLKTTWGKISTVGVFPLAPSLDTIGPMADSIEALTVGYSYLDPSFEALTIADSLCIGLLTNSQSEQTTEVFRAVFAALGYKVRELGGIDLARIHRSANNIMIAEAFRSDSHLLSQSHRMDPMVVTRLMSASKANDHEYRNALEERHVFQGELEDEFARCDLLALATVPQRIPALANSIGVSLNKNTLPFNFSGNPGLALPISATVASEVLRMAMSPQGGSDTSYVPLSLQLIAPWDSEALLLAVGKALAESDLTWNRRNA